MSEGFLPEIDPAILRKILRYDSKTGELFWRERPLCFFKAGKHSAIHIRNCWNSQHAERKALDRINKEGYRQGTIFDQGNYRAHRVIFAMVTGSWPKNEVDHINGIRSDNRFVNLRPATHQENARNRKIHSNNTSGISGVSFDERNHKWKACIGKKWLGYHPTKEAATNARKAAELEHCFT